MINQSFAEHFIRRIRTQTDYNINIMNEHGIIIASCNAERVGSFHSTAFEMLKNNISMHVTEDITVDLPGVTSPGVNLLLREGQTPVGVIGISGEPAIVMPLVKLVKLSFDSLYDYEVLRAFTPIDASTPLNELSRMLFVDKPLNLMRIRDYAKKLRIKEDINRYPVLIEYVGKDNIQHIFKQFTADYATMPSYSSNDLLFQLGGNFVLLFKQSDQQTVSTFRSHLCICIDEIETWFKAHSKGCDNHYYCGTVQNNFQHYASIYEDILWLYRYPQKQSGKIFFINDYLTEFMMSQISSDALRPLLEIHARIIRDEMKESIFVETIGALVQTNMNLNEASELLYLHKNTVAARMKKIKDLLGLSPLTNIRDAIFITALYNYLCGIHR